MGLARQAYLRAIALARAESTPWSWGRLLTAARNLGAAKRDRERAQATPEARPPGSASSMRASGTASAAPSRRRAASPPLPTPAGRQPEEGTPIVDRMPALAMPTSTVGLTRWLEMSREWERARLLREQSRLLVAQARALCSSVAEVSARWPQASLDPR